jgi:predicted secreted protein
MTIIISIDGKKAIRVEKSSFEKEDYLQKYIYENPESIPLYEIKEDTQLLILAREFPTNSGPIDAIGIDKNGEIYIVETKLFTNADKRKVIAQSLDYGAALWKHSSDFTGFLNTLNSHTQKVFKQNVNDKISEFFSLEESEVDELLKNISKNLNEGIFHFVVLMDKLDDRLKDLIIYVNQNSQFDIYAVEFQYYKHEKSEIIIPKIFGVEVKKDIAVNSTTSERRKWTEAELFEDAKQKLTKEEFIGFQKIYSFSKENATEMRLGTGSYGSFSPIFGNIFEKSLFTLSTDKRLAFNFHWTASRNEKLAEDFKNKLEGIGFPIPENYKEIRPTVLAEDWLPRVDMFIEILTTLIN